MIDRATVLREQSARLERRIAAITEDLEYHREEASKLKHDLDVWERELEDVEDELDTLTNKETP